MTGQDRTGQDRQRSGNIERTILQMVAQLCGTEVPRDGYPAEFPCPTPQSLPDAHCSNAVQ